MKVKITGKSARLLDDGEIVRPGIEYDLDDTVAAKIIADGHADAVAEVAVTESVPEPVETTAPAELANEKPKPKPRGK